MRDSPEPAGLTAAALSLLFEAMDFLEAHGMTLVRERVEGVLRLTVDGVSLTSGEVIERARALGMPKGEGRDPKPPRCAFPDSF